MLSTSVIKNVSDAGHYYSARDNYYTKEEGIEQSEWFGNSSTKLNLRGEVNSAEFTALLEGKLPNGEILGKKVDEEIKHRAGWDLTFSAPKSVSIIALVCGDKRLIEAHRNAVKAALSEIERGCSEARIKIGDDISYQNTKNLIAALYHHDLSRELDPQLHTHCVVMNITERNDGRFRSQASKMGRYDKETTQEVHGFIERVRNNKRYFGKLYEAELAYQVKELGYDITINPKTGVFEIVGIPQIINEHFSKRRNKIEKHLAEHGLTGGKAADFATINTRQNKKSVDRAELSEIWSNEVTQLGLDTQSIITQSIQSLSKDNYKFQPQETIDERAITVLKAASMEISQFKTTFLIEEVVTLAAQYAILEKIDVNTLLKATEHLIKSNEFITIHNESGKMEFMDKETLKTEQVVREYLSDNKFSQSINSKYLLSHYLNQHTELPDEVKNGLKEIFSDNRYILIEGERSREELSKPVIQLANTFKLDIEIISPTQIMGKNVAEKLKDNPMTLWQHIKTLFVDNKIKHQSVMQFLNDDRTKQPDLLFVDKSHLLSTQQVAELLAWGKDQNKQVIFFANKNVIQSRKQTVGTDYLIKYGMKTVSLREKENTAHADVANLDLHSAIYKVSKHISQISHEEDRLYAMARHFCRLDNHRSAFLIVNKKQQIQQLNILTHNELKQAGKLNEGIEIRVLVPQFLSENASKLSTSYSKEAWIRFNEFSKSLSIKKGEYLQVVSQNNKTNEVILKNDKGESIIWRPDKFTRTEYFKEKTQEFCIGERVQLTRSSMKLGILKGEHCIIQTLSKNKMKLEKGNGRSVILDLNKINLRHFDYGYANTSHGILHETPDHVIAELSSHSFHTDKRQFFQLVSAAKEVSIYTDDSQALINTLERKSGNRLSAEKVINQSEELRSSLHSIYDVLEQSIALKKNEPHSSTISKVAAEAVDYAVKHLSEREAVFTHKELMFTALQSVLGKTSAKELNDVAMRMANANLLVQVDRSDGTLWTTLDAINIERQIVTLTLQDRGKFQPFVSEETVNQYCNPLNLHAEQINAIKAITQSHDRVLSIQGRAGTGKTTLMTTLSNVVAAKDILLSQGYELYGLAPTHQAVHELTSRGIPVQTLDSFLIAMKKFEGNALPKPDFSRKIFILDEASMVSNRKMLDTLKIMHAFEARLFIPTGDTRQIASLESGKPHEVIQKTIKPIKLEQIHRQETETLKKAVKETYEYDFQAAFQTLKESIIEIGGANNKVRWQDRTDSHRLERIQALVSDYASYAPESRHNVLVITPGHEDRVLTNTLIREHLKQEGTLTGAEYSFPILTSKTMTQVERSHLKNFIKGEVVRFNKAEGKIKAGDYFVIDEVIEAHHMLALKDTNGNELLWQVPQAKNRLNSTIEVFKAETRSLQVGDVIRWSRTDKKKDLLSSEPAKITSLGKDAISIQYQDGRKVNFDPKQQQFQHWDHNYALTVYAAQGATKQTVLALLESYRENLINQAAFLVALTRSVNTFRVYTDNIAALLECIERNTGTKYSSLEVIGELKGQPSKPALEINANRSIQKKLDKYTLERVVENLNSDAEKIATDFLGKPASRGANYLQFGSNKGSLRVTIQGSKQGLWNDFSGEFSHYGKTGGNMLQFLQVFGGMNKKEAIQFGAERLGLHTKGMEDSKNDALIQWKKQAEQHKKERLKIEKNQQQSKINFAKKLANESLSSAGTLVEKYLREHRGIDLETIPSDVRFHPHIYSKLNGNSYPAMLVIARDAKGEIKAVQATYLDPKTANKLNRDDIKISKQTFGVLAGASVTVDGKNSNKILVAEGTETGLSLAKAAPSATVKIMLGKSNFLHIDTQSSAKNVMFCLDNDGKKISDDKIIFEAAKRLNHLGKQVTLIVPTALGNPKQDYNDIIKKLGPDAIKSDLNKPVSYQDMYRSNLSGSLTNTSSLQEKATCLADNMTNKSIQKAADFLKQSREFQNKTVTKTAEKHIQFDREIT